MNNLTNLEPKNVFKWFYEINQYPRSSGNEKAVSDFLVKFAKERNLEVYQDKALNVIIKKAGTLGFENSKTVIIQGHMDMVCVKTDDSNHNFETDPIEMIVDGDIIRANKTTLGGDDGIAVAFGLALLDSNDIPHPPIELLITTNEETGMDGAMALTSEHLSGTKLINIDSEEEGIFLVSCSGGATIDSVFDIERESNTLPAYEISISGLKGGHSGIEIYLQRANAIKVLARLLNSVKNDISLASIVGGIKHNSIPSTSKAVFVTENFKSIEEKLNTLIANIKEEYRVEEPDFKIEIKNVEIKESYSKNLSNRVIDFLMILPDGVQYISKDIEGLVQTSLNNAVIGEANGKLTLITSVRSASSSSLEEILNKIKSLANLLKVETKVYSTYPAWQYEVHSELRDIAISTFKECYGKEPKISSIHAGLECGLLKGILPNTEMISFGPNIKNAHSPAECMSIASVQRVWEFLKELLKNLK